MVPSLLVASLLFAVAFSSIPPFQLRFAPPPLLVPSVEFLSFEVNVHAVPKPLLDPYGVADLKDPEELYFVYVCIKNPVRSKQKDDKKNRTLQQKQGKKVRR